MSVSEEKRSDGDGPLDVDTAETVRMNVSEATALGSRALQSIGYSDEEIDIILDHLIDNALCGYKFAGLPRILAIARNERHAKPRTPIKIVNETAASAMLDGGNNVGYLAASRACDIAIEKSRHCGIAVAGIFNSYYSGRNAYYCERMTRAGLIGIHAASGEPKVITPGAIESLLGTNPFAMGFPSADGPVIYDIGTAGVMGGELLLYTLQGRQLPEGLAIDAEGLPTRDPKAALAGGIFPFGGHKGFGLSFCIQALGILAGAAIGERDIRFYGFLFIAIRPNIMLPGDAFEQRMAEMVKQMKSLRRQPGVEEIRIPFERAARERERRRVEGIVIDRTVVDALNRL